MYAQWECLLPQLQGVEGKFGPRGPHSWDAFVDCCATLGGQGSLLTERQVPPHVDVHLLYVRATYHMVVNTVQDHTSPRCYLSAPGVCMSPHTCAGGGLLPDVKEHQHTATCLCGLY
jgi:hypothetical protein